MVSGIRQHHDEESQLTSVDDVLLYSRPLATSHHPTFKEYVYNFFSSICTFMFLSILMTFALMKYVYKSYIQPHHFKYQKSREEAYPGIVKVEIISDLRYYLDLLGLDLLEYRLTTKDGFVITLYRMIDLRTKQPNSQSRPILMVHGLLQSSASFVTSGAKSLAYFLFTHRHAKFDIWLGNNRCGFEPQHLYYDNDDPRMWDWDIREMAEFDIPRMIDEILKHNTNYSKVVLMCHSQGTTQTFIGLSRQYNNIISNSKVEKFICLAPAIFPGKLLSERHFVKFIKALPDSLYDLFFGYNAFMPIMMRMRKLLYKLPLMGVFSYAMFNFLFGWNDYLWDRDLRRVHFLFSPVYISSKLMKWWLVGGTGSDLRSFNNCNLLHEESWFSNETPESLLIIGGLDELVNSNLLIEHLRAYEPFYQGKYSIVKIPNYSHLDVLWADDVIDTIGYKILDFLNKV